jgi:hypothetical protein
VVEECFIQYVNRGGLDGKAYIAGVPKGFPNLVEVGEHVEAVSILKSSVHLDIQNAKPLFSTLDSSISFTCPCYNLLTARNLADRECASDVNA